MKIIMVSYRTISPFLLFLFILAADMATYEKTLQLMTGKYSYLFYGAQE